MASMCRGDVWMCRDWIAAAELGFLVAANRRYEPVAGFGEGVGVVDWWWLRKRHGCFGLRQQGNSQRQARGECLLQVEYLALLIVSAPLKADNAENNADSVVF